MKSSRFDRDHLFPLCSHVKDAPVSLAMGTSIAVATNAMGVAELQAIIGTTGPDIGRRVSTRCVTARGRHHEERTPARTATSTKPDSSKRPSSSLGARVARSLSPAVLARNPRRIAPRMAKRTRKTRSPGGGSRIQTEAALQEPAPSVKRGCGDGRRQRRLQGRCPSCAASHDYPSPITPSALLARTWGGDVSRDV